MWGLKWLLLGSNGVEMIFCSKILVLLIKTVIWIPIIAFGDDFSFRSSDSWQTYDAIRSKIQAIFKQKKICHLVNHHCFGDDFSFLTIWQLTDLTAKNKGGNQIIQSYQMSGHVICHVSSCWSFYFDLVTFGWDIEWVKVINGWLDGWGWVGLVFVEIKDGSKPINY